MIEFNRHIFPNGLRLIHHRDTTSRFVVINTLFNVGSRNESPELTGLAHLFEHLMFGGSANIPDFDSPMQAAGGQTNAWTSTDFTNYYDILPIHNIETAFWLESDRMRALAFTPDSLEVQRKVVIEEFKETTLNVPYGDAFPTLLKMAYTKHPYRWPVIGENISHIESVTMDRVKEFFYTHYLPSNAVLSVVGNIDFDELVRMVEKWYGDIPGGKYEKPKLPLDDISAMQSQTVSICKDVPHNVIYKYYRMCGRREDDYIPTDIITDLLAGGRSSRFNQNVVLQGRGFSTLDASVWGTLDPGLLFVRGRLLPDVSFEEGEAIIDAELSALIDSELQPYEIEKCVNKSESIALLENMSQEERAYKLAYFEALGDASLINNEYDKYRAVTVDDIRRVASNVFRNGICSTLYYSH